MCVGIEIMDRRGEPRQILFDDPGAQLPLVTKAGNVAWVTWGVRDKGELRYPLALPHAGWIPLSYIAAGKVRRWHPKAVQIRADKFLVMTADDEPLWIELGAGMVIQGALIQSSQEDALRVYVVTEPPPQEYVHIHEHWPRVVRRASEQT